MNKPSENERIAYYAEVSATYREDLETLPDNDERTWALHYAGIAAWYAAQAASEGAYPAQKIGSG